MTGFLHRPLSVHGDNKTLIGCDDQKMMIAEVLHEHVCTEWGRPLEQAQAYARLFAAAPELLKMVTWLRDSHDQYLAHHGTRGTYLTPATRALIDAAIAKATGVPYDVTAD